MSLGHLFWHFKRIFNFLQNNNKILMDSIKTKYVGLNFKWKLLILFSINTLVAFGIFDLTFHIIIEKTVTNLDLSTSNEKFNEFSNTQIVESASTYVISNLDIFDEYITQIYTTMLYFESNPGIYESLEEKGINPSLTSSFSTPKFDESSVYFYTPNSTFYNEPYVDSILSNIGCSNSIYFQRVNVIYQSLNDTDDIMVRTVPGTSDFIIYNSEDIVKKIESAQEDMISISNWYYDQSSRSSNLTQIIAIRLLFTRGNTHILVEVQFKKQLISKYLKQIYSYPNKNLILAKILSSSQYSILGSTQDINSSFDLSNYFQNGNHSQTIDDVEYLITTISLQSFEPIGTPLVAGINQNSSDLRSILILPVDQTSQPSDIVYAFLDKEKETLIIIIYSWTLIMLLGAAGIALVVGNHQTVFLEFVSKKCREYTKNPQQMHKIYLEVKEAASKEDKNRLLLENLASIMQKIESKKKYHLNATYKVYNSYPKNLFNQDFQNRMQIKDIERFEEVARALQKSINEKKKNS